MGEFLKSNGFSLAAVTQIVGIAVILAAIVVSFTRLSAEVGYLKKDMDRKAEVGVVDAKILRVTDLVSSSFLRVSELVTSTSKVTGIQISHINANITLMQQDVRQLKMDVGKLSNSR